MISFSDRPTRRRCKRLEAANEALIKQRDGYKAQLEAATAELGKLDWFLSSVFPDKWRHGETADTAIRLLRESLGSR